MVLLTKSHTQLPSSIPIYYSRSTEAIEKLTANSLFETHVPHVIFVGIPVPSSPRIYNILVVEDNPGDAHLIQEAFDECGNTCKLTVAETFQSAQEALSANSFDLILSDMGVRDGESEAFIKSIRNNPRLKTIPIIVLSGSMNPRPAYEAGANAFVSKTMDMDSFFGKIKALMHFWVDVAELPPLRE